jgi:hypothetical protein
VSFTSLRYYGLTLVVKTLRKRFPNTNAASAASAEYELLNSQLMAKSGLFELFAFCHCEPQLVGAWQSPVIGLGLLRRWVPRNDKGKNSPQ